MISGRSNRTTACNGCGCPIDIGQLCFWDEIDNRYIFCSAECGYGFLGMGDDIDDIDDELEPYSESVDFSKTKRYDDFDNNVSKSKLMRRSVKELHRKIAQQDAMIKSLKTANEHLQEEKDQLLKDIVNLHTRIDKMKSSSIIVGRGEQLSESSEVRDICLD